MATLSDVSKNCKSCCDYIDDMNDMYKSRWLDEFNSYRPNEKAVEELKKVIDDYELVVIFADWCGDARRAVPALAYLENELHIKVRALGGMTKPAWGSSKLWAVPPSPPEVDTLEIRSSPTLIIFKKTGEEIGRMRTRPKMTPSVEEEILKIIKDSNA